MEFFIQLLLNGLLLGIFYATTSLGFSIIWGVMRLINLAHGEFLMMGAFVAWYFFNPGREQNLVLSVQNERVTLIVLVIIANIIGHLLLHERLKPYISMRWGDHAATVFISTIIGIIVYIIWSQSDFDPLRISMETMVFVGLALSIGFIISHVILHITMDWGTLWTRRAIGYIIGAIISVALLLLWQDADYPRIDPFGNLSFIVFIGTPLVGGFYLGERYFGEQLNWENVVLRRIAGIALVSVLSIIIFYALWQPADLPSISLIGSSPIIFIIFFAFGYVIQNGFFNRLLRGPYLAMLLVTFAVSIMLQNFGLNIYKADPRRINLDYGTAITLTEGILISPIRILVAVTSVLMLLGLVVFLKYTRTGYAIRAAGQSEFAARLMGINIREVYAITFAISMALTAIAGAMMGDVPTTHPRRRPGLDGTGVRHCCLRWSG